MTRYYYLKRIRIPQNAFSIIPFKNEKVVIGRAQTCDFVIPDILISRCHAMIQNIENVWHIRNLSSSGVTINEKLLEYNSEESLSLGDVIQFGPSPEYLYRFNMKEVEEENKQNRKENLSAQHNILETKLEQSNAAKETLLREKHQLQKSFESQKKLLELEWSEKLIQLEKVHQDGLSAHISLLQEKEHLADHLKNEMNEKERRLEDKKTKLEEQLKVEEMIRQNVLEEKEFITAALLAEKNALKEELRIMEAANVEYATRMEHDARSLQELKELHEKEEQQQQQEAKNLKAERAQMQQRLQEVKTSLEEKTELTSALKVELDRKELAEERLSVLQCEKEALEKQLQDACKSNVEAEKLKESLRNLEDQKKILEAEKLSLEAVPFKSNEQERDKIVSSVTDVVENEFQCSICNELFITAVMLNCSHTFCKYCINKWKERKKECPNCRTKITTETRSLVVDNFIDRIVETLSENLKIRRNELIIEREKEIAAERALAKAAAESAREATAQQPRGRGRNRRGNNRRAARRGNRESRMQNQVIQPIAEPVEIEPMIDLTGIETDSDGSLIYRDDADSLSSDEGNPEAYYGGYGSCFICGRRGHWAPGCPYS